MQIHTHIHTCIYVCIFEVADTDIYQEYGTTIFVVIETRTVSKRSVRTFDSKEFGWARIQGSQHIPFVYRIPGLGLGAL